MDREFTAGSKTQQGIRSVGKAMGKLGDCGGRQAKGAEAWG